MKNLGYLQQVSELKYEHDEPAIWRLSLLRRFLKCLTVEFEFLIPTEISGFLWDEGESP